MLRLCAASVLALALVASLQAWDGLDLDKRASALGAPHAVQAADSDAQGSPSRDRSVTLDPCAVALPAARRHSVEHEVERAGRRDEADLLRVRVLDPAGRAVAGMAVQLAPRSQAPRRANAAEMNVKGSIAVLRTDTDGRIHFEGFRPAIRRAREPWVLTHLVAFDTPARIVLDEDALALDEIITVQAACATAEVLVSEVDGGPAPDGSRVVLSFVDPDEPEQPLLAKERRKLVSRSVRGRALFRWLEPGRELEAIAARPHSAIFSASIPRGFTWAGGELRLGIALGAHHPVLSFRAMGPAGHPLRDSHLRIESLARSGFQDVAELVTDGEGRFLVNVADARVFDPPDWLVTHRLDQRRLLRGRARYVGALNAGLNHGGDVRLGPDPLLLAGRVVDAHGLGVAGVTIVAGDQTQCSLFDHELVMGRSAADGSFELFGFLAADEFELGAKGTEREAAHTMARAGERNVLLELITSGPLPE